MSQHPIDPWRAMIDRVNAIDPVRPDHDTHGRVPYINLSDDERQALHRWCADHGIDHTRVPIDPNITLDADDDGWHWIVEILDQRDGRSFLRDGEIAMVTVRVPWRQDLPWRMWEAT